MGFGITNTGEVKTGGLTITIAGLTIYISCDDTRLTLTTPPSYQSFLQAPSTESYHEIHNLEEHQPGQNSRLFLKLNASPSQSTNAGGKSLFRSEIWELWLQDEGGFLFTAPRVKPPRRISADAGFTRGVITADFSSAPTSIFPLQGLDTQLYANWLANFGDIILHASGISLDGKGYCFPAPSGFGKSTLIKQLVAHDKVTALGEDQVILRWQDDRFWIYGTPWHENPALCSSLGVPLQGVFFLERNDRQSTQPVSTTDSVTGLIQNAFIPFYRPQVLPAILERLTMAAETVPFWTLDYKLGMDVWQLIRAAL